MTQTNRTTSTCVFVSNRAFGLTATRLLLMQCFLDKGWQVFAAGAPEPESAVRQIEERGVTFVALPLSRWWGGSPGDLLAYWRLKRLYATMRPTLVHHFNAKPVILGGMAAAQANVPVRLGTITGLGNAFSKRLVATFATRGYRRALGAPAMTIFQNPDDLQWFVSRGIVPSERSRLILGSGVDTSRFDGDRYPLLQQSPAVFLMVSRLLRSKGVVEYVQAAHRVRAELPGVRFLLAGEVDSAHPEALTLEEIETLCLTAGVEYLGFLDDMVEALAGCTAFVLPSYYREGIPRVLMEAASMARPLITTDVPGCREVVIDGETGFVVPPRDVETLVKEMLVLARDHSQASEMGKRARALALARFDRRIVLAEHIRLYEQLMQGNSAFRE